MKRKLLILVLMFPVLSFVRGQEKIVISTDRYPEYYREVTELPKLEQSYFGLNLTEGYLDSIQFEEKIITSFIHRDDLSIAISNNNNWIIWDIFQDFGSIENLKIDTVRINNKICLLIETSGGDSRSLWGYYSKEIQIWDIQDTTCMLNVTISSSKFSISEDTIIEEGHDYPGNLSVRECDCSQKFDIQNSHLIVSPKICIKKASFEAKEEEVYDTCLEGKVPGIYKWNIDKWELIHSDHNEKLH